jgi:hypothetical protein
MVFLMPDLPLEMQLSVQMSGETIANRLLAHSAQSGCSLFSVCYRAATASIFFGTAKRERPAAELSRLLTEGSARRLSQGF